MNEWLLHGYRCKNSYIGGFKHISVEKQLYR